MLLRRTDQSRASLFGVWSFYIFNLSLLTSAATGLIFLSGNRCCRRLAFRRSWIAAGQRPALRGRAHRFLWLDRCGGAQYVWFHGLCFPFIRCLGRESHNLWPGTVQVAQPTFTPERRHLVCFHHQPCCLDGIARMDEFINYKKRGVELPPGCKDLIDVLPPPRQVRVPVEGFIHIERYLSRLLQSASTRRKVSIWSLDHQHLVHISHKDGMLKMMVALDTNDTAKEQAIVRLFSALNIPPAFDSDGRSHGIPVRLLFYPLPVSPADAADLIRTFIQRVYGLADDAGLVFHYLEKSAAKPD